ncbi:MAG: hypothetical protein JSV65_16695 [Armatimonadota bacterium]|nr:MAG: hypothetical protein JSV65_16695 [Armatimonadota bacterium]
MAVATHTPVARVAAVTVTTLREKWSIATSTEVGHKPQRYTRVISIDHTWLG